VQSAESVHAVALDLVSRVVEKGTSGLKDVLNTQV
jgi:hypothetical protein